MKATYKFDQQMVFTKAITVEDLGNVCLCCRTENEVAEYYITAQTSLGKTLIVKFGPLSSDLGMIFDSFSLERKKIDYKEPKISSEFEKFINDPKKGIAKIEEITLEEALQQIPGKADFKFMGID